MSSVTSDATRGPWEIGSSYGSYKTEIVANGRAIATVWTKQNTLCDGFKSEPTEWSEGNTNLNLFVNARTMAEALEQIATMRDGEQTRYARLIASSALEKCFGGNRSKETSK